MAVKSVKVYNNIQYEMSCLYSTFLNNNLNLSKCACDKCQYLALKREYCLQRFINSRLQ